jgi:hypothetical protein
MEKIKKKQDRLDMIFRYGKLSKNPDQVLLFEKKAGGSQCSGLGISNFRIGSINKLGTRELDIIFPEFLEIYSK